jgi:hypothetical protein
MSMVWLWRVEEKRNEVREPLARVCAWFNEGFDTLDLQEAKACLTRSLVALSWQLPDKAHVRDTAVAAD